MSEFALLLARDANQAEARYMELMGAPKTDAEDAEFAYLMNYLEDREHNEHS